MTAQGLTTLGHLGSPESEAKFRQLVDKWPGWRVSAPEHKWTDLTDCRLIGEGRHELAVFTFARHIRLSRLTDRAKPLVWVGVGPHWSDRWHDADGVPYADVPFVGIVRGISDRAAFVEPFRVLAIISCTNGRFAFDELARRVPSLSAPSRPGGSAFGNPRFRQVCGPVEPLLAAAAEVATLPAPALEPIAPARDGAFASITVGEPRGIADSLASPVGTVPAALGAGRHVVYAYTFAALEDAAALGGEELYPVKVGWTGTEGDTDTPAQAAGRRITSQVVFPEPVRVLGLLACQDGRGTERHLHGQLRPRRIRCLATEWFATNRGEVRRLMEQSTE